MLDIRRGNMERGSFDDPFYKRLHTFLHASNSETDRDRALVAASLIEEMLDEVTRVSVGKCRHEEPF